MRKDHLYWDIQIDDLANKSTASVPNMVGTVNPLSASGSCCGTDCATYPTTYGCNYAANPHLKALPGGNVTCGSFPKNNDPSTISWDQSCGGAPGVGPGSTAQDPNRNWNLMCPSLMLNGFQAGNYPNSDTDDSRFVQCLFETSTPEKISEESAWWDSRKLDRNKALKIDPGSNTSPSSVFATSAVGITTAASQGGITEVDCGGLCTGSQDMKGSASSTTVNWPGIALGGKKTDYYSMELCAGGHGWGCGIIENPPIAGACGKFCTCNWDPQLPNIPPPQPGTQASCSNILNSEQLACVQCAYGAPVSMYTDNTVLTNESTMAPRERKKHDIWMSTFSWLLPEGSTTGNPTEVGNYLEGIVLGGKS